jgi:hypothetical protein
MKFAIFLLAASTLVAQQYFPPGVFDPKPDNDVFITGWYSKCLRALKEPSLWKLSQEDPSAEIYRFLWLRSFDEPIAVRLIVTDRGGRLVSKMTSGRAGSDLGHLILDRQSPLSKQVPMFLDAIQELKFWDLPSRAPQVIGPDGSIKIGVDGAQWIIEGVKQGRYHVVDRWSPDRPDPVHVLGVELLIDIAHFRLLYQKVY